MKTQARTSSGASPLNQPGQRVVRPRSSGLFWALVPVGLLGGGLLGLGVMTVVAVDDPGFALERDYYQKALRVDAERQQDAQNAELGWQLRLFVEGGEPSSTFDLRVTLMGQEGLLDGATVTAEAFHNGRASNVRAVNFDGHGEGAYGARLSHVRPGLWELRFRVERHGTVFTHVERRMLTREGAS